MIKILLIEDNFFLRELYERVLRKGGFEVISALNGDEGVQFAGSVYPNLILLDIMLPKLNGIEVLKKIKANPETAAIPVYLLTNLGQEAIIKQALDLGAEKYLLKTNTPPDKLVAHVQSFAEKLSQK
jgi:CheY-like chemotaxis protein